MPILIFLSNIFRQTVLNVYEYILYAMQARLSPFSASILPYKHSGCMIHRASNASLPVGGTPAYADRRTRGCVSLGAADA